MNFKSLIVVIAGACCLANGKECLSKCSGGSCGVQKSCNTQVCKPQSSYCNTGTCNKSKKSKNKKSHCSGGSCSRSC